MRYLKEEGKSRAAEFFSPYADYMLVNADGRPEKLEVVDIPLEVSLAGIEAEIICRPDVDVEDEEYKLMFIRELSADEVILLEDKLENIEYIKKFLPNVEAYLVKGGNW